MDNRWRVLLPVLLVAAVVLGGLGNSGFAAGAASVPTVKKKLVLSVNESCKIKVKGKKIKNIIYKSENRKIAEVDKKGRVTAKSAGSCKIKISVRYKKQGKKKYSTKKLSCTVEVEGLHSSTGGEEMVSPRPDIAFDKGFVDSTAAFSVELMKKSTGKKAEKGENILISPHSVLTAMAMTANGAAGNTRTELLDVLAGGRKLSVFNSDISTYNNYLMSSGYVKFHTANSIWVDSSEDKGICLKQDFLDSTNKYFQSGIHSADFSAEGTVKEINDWVKNNTDGMIDNIVNRLPEDLGICLMNALAFEGKWQDQYEEHQVDEDGEFTNAAGNKEKASMLSGIEWQYVSDDRATGFIKPYQGNEYAFMALLPNKGISVSDYLQGMKGSDFLKLYYNRSREKVEIKLPEFSYEYDIEMKKALNDMGIQSAFQHNADFTAMATTKKDYLYIDNVKHKAYIELDRNGTKAAAVTAVMIKAGSANPNMEEPKKVYLDRPFLYAIIDTATGLPVFMGILNSVE